MRSSLVRQFWSAEEPAGQVSPTVREIVLLYLRYSAAHGVHGADAFMDRQRTLSLFCWAVGNLPAAECRPFHLTDFIEAHPAWRSPATRRSKANAVRAVFQWAADQERIGRNPFKAVRYPDSDAAPSFPTTYSTQSPGWRTSLTRGPFISCGSLGAGCRSCAEPIGPTWIWSEAFGSFTDTNPGVTEGSRGWSRSCRRRSTYCGTSRRRRSKSRNPPARTHLRAIPFSRIIAARPGTDGRWANTYGG